MQIKLYLAGLAVAKLRTAEGLTRHRSMRLRKGKKTSMRISLLAAVVAILACAPSVFGQGTLTLNNAGSDVMGGVYVGPYNFTLSVGGESQSVQLICDDAASEVFNGESWTTTTATFPSLDNVKFKGSNQTQNYEEIAWLVQQMYANISNPTTVGEIQWAIWDIYDPGVSSSDPWGSLTSAQQTAIASWLAQAELPSDYSTGNYSDLVIYTPVSGTQNPSNYGDPQEYFGVNTPIIPTPEPGTMALMGLGLLALGLMGRRKTNIANTLQDPA